MGQARKSLRIDLRAVNLTFSKCFLFLGLPPPHVIYSSDGGPVVEKEDYVRFGAILKSILSLAVFLALIGNSYSGSVINQDGKQIIAGITADREDKNAPTEESVTLRAGNGWTTLFGAGDGKLHKWEVWTDRGSIMVEGAKARVCCLSVGVRQFETVKKCFDLVKGEIHVTDNLTPPSADTQWNGLREGLMHKLIGKLKILHYEFDSHRETPLVFKVTKEGYQYIEGSGSVKDLNTGEVHVFKKDVP